MENTITPVDEGTVVEYIGYDQWAGAAKLARYTCDLFAKQNIRDGKVYILTGIPGFHANRRTQGYEWGLAQYCPDVTVIGSANRGMGSDQSDRGGDHRLAAASRHQPVLRQLG